MRVCRGVIELEEQEHFRPAILGIPAKRNHRKLLDLKSNFHCRDFADSNITGQYTQMVRCLLSVGVVSTRTQMEADDGRAEHSDGH
jgi:hypothetical protein